MKSLQRLLPRSLFALLILLTATLTAAQEAASSTDSTAGPPLASRLGITFIASVDTPNNEERYERALALGAGWNRWPLYWDRVETRAGRFEWAAYDALVKHEVSTGLRTNAILLGAPSFHRDEDTVVGLHEPIFSDRTDSPGRGKTINAENPWANYVFQAVRRYMPGGTLAWANGWDEGQGVRVWEVWNEPDFAQFWQGGVADYTRMLKTAHIVAHWLDPQATVMLGGLLYPTQDNWLSAVLNRIINDPMHAAHNWFVDAVAVHSYGNAWRSGWLTLYVRQTLVAFQIDRPIWLNESGVAAWDDYPGPTWLADEPDARRTRATAEQQAAFLIQSSAYAWAEGADVVFYHQLFDDCGDQAAGTNFEPHDGDLCTNGDTCFGDAFGIYRNTADSVCYARHPQPGTARPVATAYRLLADIFGAERFSRRGVIDERDDGSVTITFLRPESGERIVVAWNTRTEPLTLELDAEGERAARYTLSGGNTVLARDGVYRLRLLPALSPAQRNASPGGNIDIGGEPVILVEALDERAVQALRVRTYEPAETPEPSATPVPQTVYQSEEAVAALMTNSPTGVAFTSLNISRLRSLPNTETSRVVGTMPVGASAPVVGRTEDSGWLLIEYDGAQVWLAAFLGDVHGDVEMVPVVVPGASA